jgi:hypothetical protein
MDKIMALPVPALAAIGVLILVQLTLQVLALIDVAKRPAAHLTLPRWGWVAIIVLGEILGPIVYWVAGRKPAPAVETRPGVPADMRASDAADLLYGTRADADKR